MRGVTWPGTPRPCRFTPHTHPAEQGQCPLFTEADTGLGRSKDLPRVTRRESCGIRMCEPGLLTWKPTALSGPAPTGGGPEAPVNLRGLSKQHSVGVTRGVQGAPVSSEL